MDSHKKGAKAKRRAVHALILSLCFSLIAHGALAADPPVPGPADVGRIKPVLPELLPEAVPEAPVRTAPVMPTTPIPEGAENIYFVLKGVKVNDATAFTKEEIAEIYKPYIGKNIPLTMIWTIAEQITEYYQSRGYFLSRAYVPAQTMDNGVAVINVVEGFIGKVEIDDKVSKYHLVTQQIDALMNEKPVKSETVESFLTRLNDLPGLEFRTVLTPLNSPSEGAVKLVLIASRKPGAAKISFDNYGSRYLGPYSVNLSYQDSFIPLQSTAISLLTTTQTSELKYIAINHEAPILPNWSVVADGNFTKAEPGYTLEPFEIRSSSSSFGVGAKYQLIRQRSENLSFLAKLDARNTNTDILGDPIIRDRVRAIRLSAAYDGYDRWQGYNILNVTLSHGLSVFNASEKGDINLSRDEAGPDFSKAEVNLAHLHPLNENWSVLASVAGQVSRDPLFSSEEFGYGGQSFGRAFDASEITGDEGVSGALEFRYHGIPPWMNSVVTPYIYYDMGEVWNNDLGEDEGLFASSAGAGVRVEAASGLSAHVGIAQPLSRDIGTPIYGNGNSPRYLFGLSYSF